MNALMVWVVGSITLIVTLSLIGYIIVANVWLIFILEDFFENTMSAVFISILVALLLSAPMIVLIIYMAFLSVKQLL